VPSLIDGGRLEGGAGEWLAFDFIADARPLTEADLADNATCATVLQTLAQLHAGGVVHHDLHLGNFLLTRRHDLYAIDGDAVRAIGTGALSHRHSLDNLALFVAQFPPRDNHRISRACRVYAMARGWPDEKMDPDDLEDRIAKARGDRVRRYLKKSLRECTEFHAERSSTSFIVADRAALANGLDEVLRDLTTAVDDSPKLKIGRTATVAEVSVPSATPFVIKRYNIKNGTHALSRLFRPSRAYHAWRNAQHLKLLGVSDARPRALVERRVLRWLRRDAYLVMEKVGGADLAQHAAMEGGLSEAVIGAVVRLFADLKELRLVHGDTKATNFIVNRDGVVLIDLDSMRHVRSRRRFEARFDADLRRFLDNFTTFPATYSRLRDALAPLASGSGLHR
jgi:tRNA A-37 threonylcarbamoyl transferase component Bud32